MKIWLDDIREAPEGWRHCRSVNAAILHMLSGKVTHASLDHDLGDQFDDGGDGQALVDWMSDPDFGTWPSKGIQVHSANPVGAANMLRTIDRYSPYSDSYDNRRGDWSE